MKKRVAKKFAFLLLLFCSAALSAQVYKDPNAPVEQRVEDLLSRMTLDEKIGQMTQPNMPQVSTGEIKQYFLGSVLSGGGSTPSNNTPAGWADLYDSLQQAALATRLGIPIIYGIDAVHGHNNVKNAVIFPHNIGLGAANDPDLMERIGQITALEVAATGVDWTFAPCLTVPQDERWGRTYEGFAEDPRIHVNITAALIRGLQGPDASMGGERIVACAKHWIADGGTSWGTGVKGGINEGDAQITEAELRATHLPPYIEAINAGVGTFMSSYSEWNGLRCTGHEWLLTTFLKQELGFRGFVVSDWNSIKQLSGTYSQQIAASINAGIDMAMAPDREDWQGFISNLKTLVNSGAVPISRIDDAVRRILRIKFQAGLFEHPLTDRSLASSFGSQAHRDVAREAVRKSMVLLKNESVLPLPKNAKLFVTGRSADNLPNQCGGWTIGWQGMSYSGATTGTTILQGLQAKSTGSITYNLNGSGAQGHDFAVVVVGEEAYAESEGDNGTLALSANDQQVISQVESSGVPYVIVLVSGRPLMMTQQITNADAVVAAWLPGTEGAGVAEVLFGEYDFQGKLSYSWPRDISQVPINIGDNNYNPLYPFGHGLNYGGNNPANRGDVNSDKVVNIIDALMVAQYYVGLISQIDTAAADTNCDGAINIIDALIIAQHYVGLITQFPGCP